MRRLAVSMSVLLFFAASVNLSGCAEKQPGFVAKEWAKMVREMQITPVFPPRADIQPGDIYTDPYPTQDDEEKAFDPKNGTMTISHLISSVDLQKEVKDFYDSRFELPKTPDAEASSAAPSAATALFKTGTKTYLPIVGFPEFSYTNITQGSLGALVPINSLSLILGGAWGGVESVSLKIRSAESYGLPRDIVLDKFYKDKTNGPALSGSLEKAWPASGYARLVTEVYLTRNIEISISMKESYNATGGTKAAMGMIPLEKWADLDIAERFDKITSINKQLRNLSDPGGFFEITNLSDRSITMNRVYDFPIAVGFKFIRLVRNGNGYVNFADASIGKSIADRAPAAISKANSGTQPVSGDVPISVLTDSLTKPPQTAPGIKKDKTKDDSILPKNNGGDRTPARPVAP